MRREHRWPVVAALMLALGGCAATAPVAPAVDGITYRDDPNLQKVWLADGFRFQGYQVFLVQETRDVPNVNPDGAGTRTLRLENTIVEYEKGGGGARFFAGLYGAGQPVIRVRGRVMDGDRLVFAFEARRSGDTGLSRMFGGYRSDKAIQEEDIRDLAVDLVDFMAHNGAPR